MNHIIKSIPLNFRLPPDSLIWTKNKAGNFTVRSAYFLQRELENASHGNLASSSHSGRKHSFWNSIWSSLIPPKIKSFIWRACTDSLPLRTKFFDKHGLWSRASVYVMEFMEVNKTGLAVPIAPDRKWSPPLSDSVFKLNLALSQSRSKASVGVGFLIRNSKGEVLAASCERVALSVDSSCGHA
ncbi:hypothetical protein SO802_006388 [Lithocarpus litseifolius]|uniref:Reverse transcriptase zinc-binding domain-containing protein n=1 Tax=Lithocarpus litseifolius TaxID=425828 RepID=A0AAW2DKR4_9ROSI